MQFARRGHHRDRRDHRVAAPGQAAQHRRGIVGIDRLAEDPAVQHYFGVGAQHHRRGLAGQAQQAGTGFFARDTTDVILRRLRRRGHFREVEVEDAEVETEHP